MGSLEKIGMVGLASVATALVVVCLLFCREGPELKRLAHEMRPDLRAPAPLSGPRAPAPAPIPCNEGPAEAADPRTDPGPCPRPGTRYEVRPGDTFLGIVRKAYGNTDRWPQVWLENLDRFPEGDVSLLTPGVILVLPE